MSEESVKITPPEGYEIDKEKSTFDEIYFKKVEVVTYESIAKELFKDQCIFHNMENGNIASHYLRNDKYPNPNNALTKTQLEGLLAFNKLLNLAKYFNGPDWKPEARSSKYFLFYNFNYEEFRIINHSIVNYGFAYFKNKEDAQKALEILGEEEMLKITKIQY